MIPLFAVLSLCLPLALAVPAEKPSGRIVNGNLAVKGQFPYQASIHVTNPNGYLSHCSGAILNSLWIVTAGHCMIGAKSATVDVGSNSYGATDSSRVSVAVSKIVVHEAYDGVSFQNNIALLQLNNLLSWSTTIQPISILRTSIADNTNVDVSGWGSNATKATQGSADLRFVALKTINNKQCIQTYGTKYITDDIICTVSNNDVIKGFCAGDEGAPLVTNLSTKPILVGIGNFWSNNGCESGNPDAYAKMSYFADWIRNVAGA